MMRFFVYISFFIFVSFYQIIAEDLNEKYYPTRAEWLELSIFKTIKIRTDVWSQRIGFIVSVDNKNGISITLSSSNGQEVLEDSKKNKYIEIIKKDIESLTKQYNWSKNLKVFVQFI